MDSKLRAPPPLTFSELTAQELLAELKQELQQGFDRCSEKLAEDIKNLLVQSTPLPLAKGHSMPPLASSENQPTKSLRELTEESHASLRELTGEMAQVWAEPKRDEVDLRTERPIVEALQPTNYVERCDVVPEEKKPDIIAETDVRNAAAPEEKQPSTMPDNASDHDIVEETLREEKRRKYSEERRQSGIGDERFREAIHQDLSRVRKDGVYKVVSGFLFSSETGDKGRTSVPDASTKRRLLYRCAVSRPFNFMCMAVIVTNAIWLGYDVNHQIGKRTADWHVWVSHSFTIWFMVELTFKIIGLQKYFVTGPDWKWNLFDMVLVLLSFPELFSSSMNVSLLRIMRLSKLTKTLRVVRVLRFAKSLREIIMTVILTFGTLFWCFVAIIMVNYTSAIMILEALIMSLDEDVQFSELTMHTFRSVWSTMMALFGMISSGMDWYIYADDFEVHGAHFPQYLLAIWIYFMMFGFLNIVLAVFCAQSTDATLHDFELRLEDQTLKRQAKMTEMVELWGMIDTEDRGSITWEQFYDFGAGPEGQSYLQSHGLELSGLRSIWRVMNAYDGSEDDVVDLASFIMAFSRLSGENVGTELVVLSDKLTALRKELRDAFHELRTHSKGDSDVHPRENTEVLM